MADEEGNSRDAREAIGLCADCRFLRRQGTRRGAVFFRCGRADVEAGFLRYPPLPVLECPGYERGAGGGGIS